MTEKPEKINDDIMLLQNAGSLAFGTDAYLLSAYLRSAPKQTACELGTGSGVISLLAAARGKFAHITAVELQQPLASLAVRNVEKNGFSDKIDVICADIRQIAPGITTATLLSIGRAIGDAAGVMFTAGYTDSIPTSLSQPAATLPLAVFFQLSSPIEEVQGRAYAAALILTIIVLILSILGRFITNRFSKNKI